MGIFVDRFNRFFLQASLLFGVFLVFGQLVCSGLDGASLDDSNPVVNVAVAAQMFALASLSWRRTSLDPKGKQLFIQCGALLTIAGVFMSISTAMVYERQSILLRDSEPTEIGEFYLNLLNSAELLCVFSALIYAYTIYVFTSACIDDAFPSLSMARLYGEPDPSDENMDCRTLERDI